MAILNSSIEKDLWDAADLLRTNSRLKSSEYATPVLGLIFLKYADFRFACAKQRTDKEYAEAGKRRKPNKTDYQAQGIMYLPETARYEYLLNLPEDRDIREAVIQAIKDVEEENPLLKDVILKQPFKRIPKDILVSLLKKFNSIEMKETNGDTFGAIYEYFLGKFALAEGQKGGEFFTPNSLVRLIVEIVEPHHGMILDPACGSGGMFVQSAKFVNQHNGDSGSDISIYGQENIADTVRLCKMNLAVHGFEGDVKLSNTYYENIHGCYQKMNYVLANPPFNAKGVDKKRIRENDPRYPFGMPSTDNANYLWIQEFYSAMKPGEGKAGFVMANSAADARGVEQEIRKQIIQKNAIDVMISIGPNFFYTVTLPCTLWFFDNHKTNHTRKDSILFIDARTIFTQVDRAHREFSAKQIEYIANIVRLYHNKDVETTEGSETFLKENGFQKGRKFQYQDVPGLCKIATLAEVEAQGWSLNPGRYVGTQVEEFDEDDFWEKFSTLNSELQQLNKESKKLEKVIEENFVALGGMS